VAVISSFIFIDFPHFFQPFPDPAVAPPLELRLGPGIAGVGAGVGAPRQCASSDTELLEVERIVRGETGGEGVEEPEGLESWGLD